MFSVLKGLQQGVANVEGSVYEDPTGRFSEAQADDCASARPPFGMAEELIVKHIIGFYELYYDADKLLPVPAVDWKGVCEGARSFVDANCLVKKIWDEEFPRMAPPVFRESFRTCTL